MKKIILIFALLLSCSISLMAQNLINGGSIDQGESLNGYPVSVKAYSDYNKITKQLEIVITHYYVGNYGITLKMQGSINNIIPVFINETVTSQPQKFCYYLRDNSQYSRVWGTIDFVFEDQYGSSVTIPMLVGIRD